MVEVMNRPDATTGTTTAKTVGAHTVEEKVMTVEILKDFVEEATREYFDRDCDYIYECNSEDTTIDADFWYDMWSNDILFSGGSTEYVGENIEEMCNEKGYDINLYRWCEENDIDLEDMIGKVACQAFDELYEMYA